jgi:hypothetical protein
VPIVSHYEPGSRQNVGERLPDFIVEGATRRAEVLMRMGEPDGRGPGDRWFAYGSRYNEGGVLFVAGGAGGVAGAGAESIRYRRIVIRFDDQGVVTAAGLVERACVNTMVALGSTIGSSPPCLDVAADGARVEAALPPAAGSASDAGARRTTRGRFETATVRIAPAEVVEPRTGPPDARLAVTDRRTNIVMERTTVGGRVMSGIVLQPNETDLIASIVGAKLSEAITMQSVAASAPPVTCEVTEFAITTPATLLYWDVTADVAITLRVENQKRSLSAHAVDRTYLWPTEALIKAVTIEALRAIAAESGTWLRELIALAPAD